MIQSPRKVTNISNKNIKNVEKTVDNKDLIWYIINCLPKRRKIKNISKKYLKKLTKTVDNA